MRYETRWSNGFWKVFDTIEYTSIEAHHTKASVDEAVRVANEWEAKRKP